MNLVEISYENIRSEEWEENLVVFVQKVLHYLNISNWELSIVFCNDEFIKELNSTYRNKDEPTDVLSFNQDLDQRGNTVYAGDIVVSKETVERNAYNLKVPLEEELKRVIIHGILHLNGMDHISNDFNEPMLKKQEEIIYSLGGETLF